MCLPVDDNLSPDQPEILKILIFITIVSNQIITQIEGSGLERLGGGRNFSARQIR